MALFRDDPSLGEGAPTTPPDPAERRRYRGWYLIIGAFVLALVLAMTPAPYVIEKPGPVFNTLGTDQALDTDQAEGEAEPLITITGHETYPTTGSLDLLTVRTFGNPDRLPAWSDVVASWFSPREAALPLDAVYPPDVSVEERTARAAQQMTDSQNEAIAAALTHLGFDVDPEMRIVEVYDGGPAEGILQEGDRLITVNGAPALGISSLRNAITANGTDSEASITVERDGDTREVQVRPVKAGDSTILGIGVNTTYTFPFTVTIKLNDVGGPSAGMMFALGIVDMLTPGSITGGAKIAGTGTIDNEGTVGAIGGIRQKMFAAADAGARWFLAPHGNCAQVRGHVPDGLRVVSVRTLDDAVAAVSAIGDEKGTKALPSCTAE